MLRHKNLLVCYGAATKDPNAMLIITEWIPKGSLRDLLKDTLIEISWPMIFSLSSGIGIQKLTLLLHSSFGDTFFPPTAHGMRFLHSLLLVHGDLKSNNVMVRKKRSCSPFFLLD